MKIVAKSTKGQEFLYSVRSAHEVPKTSAEIICNALNDAHYDLAENEVWHIHDVDRFDRAYEYAVTQRFERRNGKICQRFRMMG